MLLYDNLWLSSGFPVLSCGCSMVSCGYPAISCDFRVATIRYYVIICCAAHVLALLFVFIPYPVVILGFS